MPILSNHRISLIFLFTLFVGLLAFVFVLHVLSNLPKNSLPQSSSKWRKNRLVLIPAIYLEIEWHKPSSWPFWLRRGLDSFEKNLSRPYDVYLYQRIDPQSQSPYHYPYCPNVREETGVYLKFIHDHYNDLPDRMLFIHGKPSQHANYPIESVQCIRDDVFYVNINNVWIQDRPWSSSLRDPTDNLTLLYKCARHLLNLFGFDGEAQLNPTDRKPSDDNVISAMCCSQFYVRKERILHYTHKQWSAVYNASLQPYCTTPLDQEVPIGTGMKYFGGSFEYLWHVILGLNPTNMIPPRKNTYNDLCHLFRPSCDGTLCSDYAIKYLSYSKNNKTNK